MELRLKVTKTELLNYVAPVEASLLWANEIAGIKDAIFELCAARLIGELKKNPWYNIENVQITIEEL